jgi:hypothetical protein
VDGKALTHTASLDTVNNYNDNNAIALPDFVSNAA